MFVVKFMPRNIIPERYNVFDENNGRIYGQFYTLWNNNAKRDAENYAAILNGIIKLPKRYAVDNYTDYTYIVDTYNDNKKICSFDSRDDALSLDIVNSVLEKLNEGN